VTAVEPDVEPDETPAKTKHAAAGHDHTRRWLALTTVLLVVMVALGALAAAQRPAVRERAERRAIERVAREVGTGLLTYDYRDLTPSHQAVIRRATPKFAKEFESAYDAGLRAALVETKAVSQGKVTSVYIGTIRDGRVSAVIVADSVTDGTAGRREVRASYTELELVKVNGSWRVDGVANPSITLGGAS
jgi:hypothetical protein